MSGCNSGSSIHLATNPGLLHIIREIVQICFSSPAFRGEVGDKETGHFLWWHLTFGMPSRLTWCPLRFVLGARSERDVGELVRISWTTTGPLNRKVSGISWFINPKPLWTSIFLDHAHHISLDYVQTAGKCP